MSHRGLARCAIDKRTDAVFAAQCDLAGKIAIPLASTGTGAGVFTMRIYSTSSQIAYINGRGMFYSDAGGTTGASPVTSIASNAWTTIYIKVPSGSSNLVFTNKSAITKWGDASNYLFTEAVNAPKINGFNISYIGSSVTSVRIYSNLAYSTINGSIAGLTSLTYLYLSGNTLTCSGSISSLTSLTVLYFDSNTLTCSGSVAGLTSLTYLYLLGSSLTCSGSISTLTLLTYLYLFGTSLTCSGSVAGLTSLTYLRLIGGSLTCSGNIAGLTSLTYLYLAGSSLTCSYNTSSGSSIRLTSRLYVTISSFTSNMVDAILIDTDNNTTVALSTQPIYLVNGNAPTSASAAARSSLTSKGNVVTTS